MKSIYYPVVFHPEEVGFSVSAPDIDGCFTQGDSMDEAVSMIQEAIGLLLEDQETYPAASNPKDIALEPNDFIVVVPFDSVAYRRKHDTRAVKKTLSIPSWLNTAAEAAHLNFSRVLQDALKQQLGIN